MAVLRRIAAFRSRDQINCCLLSDQLLNNGLPKTWWDRRARRNSKNGLSSCPVQSADGIGITKSRPHDHTDDCTGLMLECGRHVRLLNCTAMLIRAQLEMMAFEFVNVTYKTMLVLFLDEVYMHISMIILCFTYVISLILLWISPSSLTVQVSTAVRSWPVVTGRAVLRADRIPALNLCGRLWGLFLVTPDGLIRL